MDDQVHPGEGLVASNKPAFTESMHCQRRRWQPRDGEGSTTR